MTEAAETCFHCGLINEVGDKYPVRLNNKTELMCCPGCQAVCESIIDLGLTDYYLFREKLPEVSPKDLILDDPQIDFYDHEKVKSRYVTSNEGEYQSTALMIGGIVCSACTWLIETRLSAVEGVIRVSVNQTTSRAAIDWDDSVINLSDILKAINQLGYQAYPYNREMREQHLVNEKKAYLKRLAVAGLGMMQVMMYSLGFYLDANLEMSETTATLLRWVSLLISAPVVFYAASPFYLSAAKNIRNFSINMDVPVTIAIFSAWFASLYATITGRGDVYFDSVSMFVFFLLIGRYLQMIAIHRSGRVLEQRLNSTPETAIILRGGAKQRILLDDVVPGDLLQVKPGQQIPCDAIIESGETNVDESILTGEADPKLRLKGERVAAGSVNTGNVINIRVINSAKESTLSGIINLLQKAQQAKPAIQLLADKIASYFVATVLFLAIATGLFWYWYDSSQMFNIVLAVLVVTCPCALSLATPVALTAGLGKLTEQSLLLNRTAALPNLCEVTDVIFDKTGTLTSGRFKLKSLKNYSQFADDEILNLISLMESHSDHPVASAFASEQVGKADYRATEVKIIPSQGITANIDGTEWLFGNRSMLADITCPDAIPDLAPGQLQLFLISNNQCQAMVIIETEIRPDASTTIESLKAAGIRVHLLSGDNSANVRQIAQLLDIEQYKAEQSPEDKLAYLKQIQASGSKAAMVGDGINDSPAMAAALVSFAIAKSTDITKVSADIIMMSEKLSLITDAMRISKAVKRVIKQNLGWALSYNLLGLPLAVSGLLSPWLAAAGMSFSSLVVVLNALRLSRKGQQTGDVA